MLIVIIAKKEQANEDQLFDSEEKTKKVVMI